MLGEPDHSGHHAVERDIQRGSLERLLDASVGDAGHVVDPRQQVGCQLAVLHHVGAADLDVDRGRRAEIQDLAHHVGRQKRKGHTRELARQDSRSDFTYSAVGIEVIAQGDEKIGIDDADGARVAVGHVRAAEWQPDIVDGAENHRVG